MAKEPGIKRASLSSYACGSSCAAIKRARVGRISHRTGLLVGLQIPIRHSPLEGDDSTSTSCRAVSLSRSMSGGEVRTRGGSGRGSSLLLVPAVSGKERLARRGAVDTRLGSSPLDHSTGERGPPVGVGRGSVDGVAARRDRGRSVEEGSGLHVGVLELRRVGVRYERGTRVREIDEEAARCEFSPVSDEGLTGMQREPSVRRAWRA